MIHITKYCPNCHKAVSGMGGRNDYLYGSPIRTCPNCFHKYVDKQYHEIAIDGVLKGHTKRITFIGAIALIVSFGILVLGLYCIYTGATFEEVWPTFLAPIIISILPIMKISSYKKDMEFIKDETRRSEERIKNPAYIKLLQELGYSIPSEYLNTPAIQPNNNPFIEKPNNEIIEEIKKYKELLDNDILTKEESDAKKKQLLGL